MTKVKDAANNNNDLAIREFKLGCNGLLDELKSFHFSKKRQIELCFDKLLDNIPNDILNAPINKCIEDYLEIMKSKEFEVLNPEAKIEKPEIVNGKEFVVDQSICDTTIGAETTGAKATSNITALDDEHDILVGKNSHQGFNNLTSTVKKVNSGKLQSLKLKIDEQSIIQEVDIDETPYKPDQKNVAKPQQQQQKETKPDKPIRSDQIAVRVVYFLKDFTQISTKLDDLSSVELKLVHEKCVDDLNLICKAVADRD